MRIFFIACLTTVLISTVHAQTFSDGAFNVGDWSSTIIFNTATNPVATQISYQGTSTNYPGNLPPSPPYRITKHDYGSGAIIVAHLKTQASYQGPINEVHFSARNSFLESSISTNDPYAVGYLPLIRQNSTYYQGPSANADDNSWNIHDQPGLIASDFTKVGTIDPGPANPVFGCDAPEMEFGYFTSNSNPNAGAVDENWIGVDDWNVQIDTNLDCPEFSINKSLLNCVPGTGANTSICTYDIVITNSGDPYQGDLEIEEISNVHTISVDMFDASSNAISCQYFLPPVQSQTPLVFSNATIIADFSALCTVPNVFIDSNTPLNLTATVEMDTSQLLGPGAEPLNCALVVLWDNRPSGMATDEFPSSCIPVSTPCELHVSKTTSNYQPSVGDPLGFEIEVTNAGGSACETARVIDYWASAASVLSPIVWETYLPDDMEQAPPQPNDDWRSPSEYVAIIQQNFPSYQYSFPAGALVIGGPDVPTGDIIREPNVPLQPGDQHIYSTTNARSATSGMINCAMAVVNISDYDNLRFQLSLASLIKPLNLSSSVGNDDWANSINSILANNGVTGVSCVGFNVN